MILVKLTEMEDGAIVAETPRQVLGRFRNTRDEVIRVLTHKARENGLELRVVEDFENFDENANIDFQRLMRRKF